MRQNKQRCGCGRFGTPLKHDGYCALRDAKTPTTATPHAPLLSEKQHTSADKHNTVTENYETLQALLDEANADETAVSPPKTHVGGEEVRRLYEKMGDKFIVSLPSSSEPGHASTEKSRYPGVTHAEAEVLWELVKPDNPIDENNPAEVQHYADKVHQFWEETGKDNRVYGAILGNVPPKVRNVLIRQFISQNGLIPPAALKLIAKKK